MDLGRDEMARIGKIFVTAAALTAALFSVNLSAEIVEVILPQEFGHGVKLLSQIASEYYCK